jgi:hypothetical protein
MISRFSRNFRLLALKMNKFLLQTNEFKISLEILTLPNSNKLGSRLLIEFLDPLLSLKPLTQNGLNGMKT